MMPHNMMGSVMSRLLGSSLDVKARVCLLCMIATLNIAQAQTVTPTGTFNTWPVRSDPVLRAYYPLESVDDVTGLTAQVGGPAMVTANGAVCCNAGNPSNGFLYWNPTT